jgi:hypothetical protein
MHYLQEGMQKLRHTLNAKLAARFIGELELIQAPLPLR